ncbi:uncharacterized protein LOC129913620 [Episyrphus balteatus]|uniref:uncharacterized protein LOC129913620 n=1 Tax=Episyrphus balteatus TaxID=286459 RepID=UPI002484F0E3|nr:uncharacterized protein LOC129913620 [Episyrphus balteatus]
MNSIILVFLSVLVLISAASLRDDGDIQELLKDEDIVINEKITIKGRKIQGRSLSSRGEKVIQKYLDKMPYGFPELQLPPLAPFVKDQIDIELKDSFAEISANFKNIRIEGLDDLLINHFEINYVFSQEVLYNFTFPKIIATGSFLSDSIMDLIKEFGINVHHYGNGDFEIIFENLTLEGYFKYTMPLAWGSISIYNFKGSVELGNISSNIDGLAGESNLSQLINEKIEEFGMKFVQSNQELINNMVRDFLIPMANVKLEGKTVWSLIG